MENNNVETVENTVDNKDTNNVENTNTESEKEGAVATFTQEDVDKKVQSECDKLRTTYTKKIKELEGKIEELSPVEKSETELELERRLSELEKSQAEVNAQKAFLALQDTLQSKGIDKSIATYLKEDVDVEEFANAFNGVIKESAKSNGFVPDTHNAGDKISAEEFSKMKYSEKLEIMNKSPELYKRLMAKIKK